MSQDTTLPPLLPLPKPYSVAAAHGLDDLHTGDALIAYAQDYARAAIAAQAPQPLAPAPSTFDLTEARAIVVDAIRRMRAAHVGCLDLTMKAEGFLGATHAAAKSDQLWTQTLEERDRYHEVADKLAQAIAKHLGIDIGEHSSANCPWDRALEALDDGASVQAQQAQGVPVGEIAVSANSSKGALARFYPSAANLMPGTQLYAAAPQAEPQPEREPLADEQIDAIQQDYMANYVPNVSGPRSFARAIEQAHGIGAKGGKP